MLRVGAMLVLLAALSAAQITPDIQITSLPTYGAVPGSLSGRVVGVSPTAYSVTALVFISGLGFYTKPFCSATTTPLAADGSFNVLLTTGGIDQYATRIAILVMPASATVPCYLAEPGVPAALEQQAVAETLISRPNPNQREIQFSGETWVVKSSPAPVGPGPNYFSDSPENVWVDNLGRLHLQVTNRGGTWYCAEIVSKRLIGYGRYTVQIDTSPQLDKNVIFGAFSYADAERVSHEIDMLELGKFGNANDSNNAQNVVQPFTTQGNQMRFVLPQIAPTVHKMTWLQDTLSFQSLDQFGGLLHQWTYAGQRPTTDSDRLNFRLNLWLVAPPSDGKEAEIIVNRLSFTPISKAGIFRSAFFWLLDVDGNQQFNIPPDRAFAFGGIPGDIPITGDWNGSGSTKVGVYRSSNGLFILDYDGDGQLTAADKVFNLGVGTQSGDVPVVGDWNGDGRTKVGLFRQGFFWILDYNGNGVFEPGIDKTYAFGGIAGDVPVVGDWDGSGRSKLGLFRAGFLWILDVTGNGVIDPGTKVFGFGGIPGDVPVIGDWNGDGRSKVGVFRAGFFWVLDANGNCQFDGVGPGQDVAFGFGGISGDKPVIGKW